MIYNRLARGTPLQMDSTVLYAEGRDGGPVTSADETTSHAVQHLSAHGAHAHPHLLPLAASPCGPPSTPRPGTGSTS